ncbi:MAG TPA: hypothetical protein VGJ84_08330 [Polyangiaceae bacterium]|jgi:hypothetical protein
MASLGYPAFAALWLLAVSAAAQPMPPSEPAPPPARSSDEDRDAELPLIPPALDTISGHFVGFGSAGLAVPFGDRAARSGAADAGLALGLDAGVGISRTVVLGIWGQSIRVSGGNKCGSCSLTSFAVGPFVRYHLVQGVRFDPWLQFGAGFRTLSIGTSTGDQSYSGVDWMRLQVGGDWYVFSTLGVGPFLELDSGVYTNRPSGSGKAVLHWQFAVGARVGLDIPGK